jgi:hypothetical protein
MAKNAKDQDIELYNQHRWEDHNLLIEVKTEVQNIRNDLREIKDGTGKIITKHEERLEILEKWQATRIAQIKGDKNYLNFIVGLGIIILALVVWHLTGAHIP